MKKTIFVLVILSFLTCSNDNSTNPKIYANLTGEWDSNVEVTYMNLVQNDESITGEICEAENFDCTIEGGNYKDGIFSFHYSFGSEPTIVDGQFEINPDGNRLTGTITKRGTNQILNTIYNKR